LKKAFWNFIQRQKWKNGVGKRHGGGKRKPLFCLKQTGPTWPKIKWKIKTECHGVDSIYNNAETLWGHT
jgi:hypothetical protein